MANSDNTILTLKTWFEQTLSWLHVDSMPDTLQRPHRQLLDLMTTARNENRPNQVWALIEEMEKLTIRMIDIREQGEVFIRCAKMAGDLENLKDALRLCQAAESKYKSYQHQRATTLWMIGCIHWVNYQRVDAISNWQEAIFHFKERQTSVQIDTTKTQWYVEMVPQLEEYLERAITQEGLPPYYDTPSQNSNPTPVSNKKSEAQDVLRWIACTISDTVPAGGFGPVGFDPNPSGHLEITEVLIDNEPYKVFSMKRISLQRNTVNIMPSLEYKTVRVKGTSMNAAQPTPLNDGDYILVRLQNMAIDNDIVVAGIFEFDTSATVKRLRIHDNKIQLVPESTDSSHYNNFEFERDFKNSEVNIVGVVEAVFKKK